MAAEMVLLYIFKRYFEQRNGELTVMVESSNGTAFGWYFSKSKTSDGIFLKI
jgi:hypothetical protein